MDQVGLERYYIFAKKGHLLLRVIVPIKDPFMDRICLGRVEYLFIANILKSTLIGVAISVIFSIDQIGFGRLSYHFITNISMSTLIRSGNTY